MFLKRTKLFPCLDDYYITKLKIVAQMSRANFSRPFHFDQIDQSIVASQSYYNHLFLARSMKKVLTPNYKESSRK